MPDIRDVIEAFVGPSIAEEIAKQYSPYEVGWLQGYAYELGQASDRPQLEYRAYALPGETINALAIPGGNVYIYEGALAKFDKRVVSGLLGHEIAHVAKRHCMNSVIATYGIDLLISMYGQGRARDMADLITNILWRSYGREKEFEADISSIHYNQRADLWPYGIKYLLEWLLSVEERPEDSVKEFIYNILATHPPATERLQRVNAEIERLGIAERSLIFEKLKAALPWLLALGIGGGLAALLIHRARKK